MRNVPLAAQRRVASFFRCPAGGRQASDAQRAPLVSPLCNKGRELRAELSLSDLPGPLGAGNAGCGQRYARFWGVSACERVVFTAFTDIG